MTLYSTNNPQHTVNFKEAIFRGLPPDNGLYMPSIIPEMSADFWNTIGDRSFQENSYLIASAIQAGAIPDNDLKSIINEAMDFPVPVVRLDDNRSILELFHGPSLAFKDFGARYMARIMSYFNRGEDKTLNILVATSGDTGGAVAFGFHKVPGIRVVILYPSGKVSHLQEQQLTTLGHNVTAIEVDGTFDDCQAMVKKAFLDQDLTSAFRLSSANSINIARLIPQMFYYAEAYRQVRNWTNRDIVFAVPSGNYGNLTAG
ncbi:MAG: threonine synthase, partial [Saprospiraceae bacterium]|nr:threonine synthase [Saprospiraceae bacterium]